jgi:hypothetical protein
MPTIVEEVYYNGAKERIERLGLTPLVAEVKSAVTGFQLLVQERVDTNGGAAVRKLIDEQFRKLGGWTRKVSGDLDWVKCKSVNGTRVCIGVEVQVSARSNLLVMDMDPSSRGVPRWPDRCGNHHRPERPAQPFPNRSRAVYVRRQEAC